MKSSANLNIIRSSPFAQAELLDEKTKSTELTTQDIEDFYRDVTILATDEKFVLHSMCTQIKQNYLQYLRRLLAKTSHDKSTLISQIRILYVHYVNHLEDRKDNGLAVLLVNKIIADLSLVDSLQHTLLIQEDSGLIDRLKDIEAINSLSSKQQIPFFSELSTGLAKLDMQNVIHFSQRSIVDEYYDQGIKYCKEKQWLLAIRHFQMVLEQLSKDDLQITNKSMQLDNAKLHLGIAYSKLGKQQQCGSKEAVEYYHEAVKFFTQILVKPIKVQQYLAITQSKLARVIFDFAYTQTQPYLNNHTVSAEHLVFVEKLIKQYQSVIRLINNTDTSKLSLEQGKKLDEVWILSLQYLVFLFSISSLSLSDQEDFERSFTMKVEAIHYLTQIDLTFKSDKNTKDLVEHLIDITQLLEKCIALKRDTGSSNEIGCYYLKAIHILESNGCNGYNKVMVDDDEKYQEKFSSLKRFLIMIYDAYALLQKDFLLAKIYYDKAIQCIQQINEQLDEDDRQGFFFYQFNLATIFLHCGQHAIHFENSIHYYHETIKILKQFENSDVIFFTEQQNSDVKISLISAYEGLGQQYNQYAVRLFENGKDFKQSLVHSINAVRYLEIALRLKAIDKRKDNEGVDKLESEYIYAKINMAALYNRCGTQEADQNHLMEAMLNYQHAFINFNQLNTNKFYLKDQTNIDLSIIFSCFQIVEILNIHLLDLLTTRSFIETQQCNEKLSYFFAQANFDVINASAVDELVLTYIKLANELNTNGDQAWQKNEIAEGKSYYENAIASIENIQRLPVSLNTKTYRDLALNSLRSSIASRFMVYGDQQFKEQLFSTAIFYYRNALNKFRHFKTDEHNLKELEDKIHSCQLEINSAGKRYQASLWKECIFSQPMNDETSEEVEKVDNHPSIP